MSFQFNDSKAPSISGPHRTGPAVVFADGITAYRLRPPLSPVTLRALVETQSKNPVQRSNLVHWDGKYLTE